MPIGEMGGKRPTGRGPIAIWVKVLSSGSKLVKTTGDTEAFPKGTAKVGTPPMLLATEGGVEVIEGLLANVIEGLDIFSTSENRRILMTGSARKVRGEGRPDPPVEDRPTDRRESTSDGDSAASYTGSNRFFSAIYRRSMK